MSQSQMEANSPKIEIPKAGVMCLSQSALQDMHGREKSPMKQWGALLPGLNNVLFPTSHYSRFRGPLLRIPQ